MVESGKSQGLAAEMAADSVVGDGPGEEKLEGDFAVEVLILAAIDNTHPPLPIFSLIR
jgi:hypothetical protein